jgi:hypothetical protein
MSTSVTGAIHLFATMVVPASGARVRLRPKIPRTHELAGPLCVSGVSLNISAPRMFRISADFSPIQVAEPLSSATLTAGLV